MGSSPRVRGKRATSKAIATEDGLIPACAGKTITRMGPNTRSRAHPRVCGENEILTAEDLNAQGSSPRVRGKRWNRCHPCYNSGLIPACAGKTVRRPSLSMPGWAHPRVCGENIPQHGMKCPQPGSSPRVRGKQRQGEQLAASEGLIPACAGKTLNDLEF